MGDCDRFVRTRHRRGEADDATYTIWLFPVVRLGRESGCRRAGPDPRLLSARLRRLYLLRELHLLVTPRSGIRFLQQRSLYRAEHADADTFAAAAGGQRLLPAR